MTPSFENCLLVSKLAASLPTKERLAIDHALFGERVTCSAGGCTIEMHVTALGTYSATVGHSRDIVIETDNKWEVCSGEGHIRLDSVRTTTFPLNKDGLYVSFAMMYEQAVLVASKCW